MEERSISNCNEPIRKIRDDLEETSFRFLNAAKCFGKPRRHLLYSFHYLVDAVCWLNEYCLNEIEIYRIVTIKVILIIPCIPLHNGLLYQVSFAFLAIFHSSSIHVSFHRCFRL